MQPFDSDPPLQIAGRLFTSRLLVGTGKYASSQQMQDAIVASGAEIVTVAIQHAILDKAQAEPDLLALISPDNYTILPNTAGCYNAESAVRICQLARELVQHDLVKLEIIGDSKTLLPDMVETLAAARQLVAAGFQVLVYTNDDLIVAKRLQDIGCAAIMPLASPIGSGLGICSPENILFIVEQIEVPVIIDAGIGTASDAVIAMELGCDAVLLNTAIARAQAPVVMASAMRHAVFAGRAAYLSGRIPAQRMARASSPTQRMARASSPIAEQSQ